MVDYRLKSFLTVCDTLSYTQAARALHMSQPTVTQHIQYLERLYGVSLFHYDHKKLTLTTQGQVLRKYAIGLFADQERIRLKLNDLDEIQNGSIRFGASQTIGEFIMSDILVHYMRNQPAVSLSMRVDSTMTLLSLLNKGEIDFALVEGYFDKQEYDYCKFSEEPFIGICAASSPLAGRMIRFIDLFQERLIVPEKGSDVRRICENLLQEHNMSLESIKHIEIGNVNVITKMVARGEGVAFCYQVAVQDKLETGEIVKLEIENFAITKELGFVYQKESCCEESGLAFLEFCSEIHHNSKEKYAGK